MSYLFLTLGLVVFMLTIRMLGVVDKVLQAIDELRASMVTLSAPALSDRAKEQALQHAAMRTGGLFLDILLSTTTALVAATASLLAGNALGLYGLRDALSDAQNPLFLLFLMILGVAALRWAR